MTVVFYSTNASRFDGDAVRERAFPRRAAAWEAFCALHPQDRFIVATQLPASFLADREGNALADDRLPVRTVLLRSDTPAALAQEIAALKPDLAIAATFWVPPFDWLPVQDAMVAEELRARGIDAVCHPAAVALDCYDKWRTHLMLRARGVPVAEALHFDWQQFWCERSHPAVTSNVYKAYLLRRLERMPYPVVIKDTTGLSSYGMEVATTYPQALHYLRSGRTRSDRIIETYLSGEQFGTEIYGRNGTYAVLDPFLFSVNRYGITSPKQSVKIGPVTGGQYDVPALKAMLTRLARDLRLEGVAQVDLAYSDGKWHVIEINPRLSGMSETYAASLGIPLYEMLFRAARAEPLDTRAQKLVCNLKMPLLDDAQLESLASNTSILYIHQIHNTAAKQEREKGYCEIVLGGTDGTESILRALDDLAARFPHLLEPAFVQAARNLARKLG